MTNNCNSTVKFYNEGKTIHMIERDDIVIVIDITNEFGVPIDLNGATAKFHLMDFSTRTHVWTKDAVIVYSPISEFPNVTYPYTVRVPLLSSDTNGLVGHYTGQLQVDDFLGDANYPFQVEIIIAKNAYQI